MATTRTVLQLIESALRVIGAISVGDSISSETSSTSLAVLQDVLAEYAGDVSVPIVVQEAITLVSAQNSYTVGENGSPDLSSQRPEQITGAWVRASNYDYPVKIIGERAYNAIVSKTSSGRPELLWYNPTVPNGTVYTYPTPTTAESLYISSIKSLPEPTAITENLLNTVGIPRNYHNPLKWILALELAEEFGMPITQNMYRKEQLSRGKIISLNAARRVQAAPIDMCGDSDYRGTILSY